MLPPDIQPHVESFWPTSVIGWLTAGTLATAVGKTAYDWMTGRRKSLGTLQTSIKDLDREVKQMNTNLCAKIEDAEHTTGVMDAHLKTLSKAVNDLVYDWMGRDGTNGGRSKIKELDRRTRNLEDWRGGLAAIAEHERQSYHGPERRQGPRREKDRELNNLLPEEREEKA